jgi:hypothetical protein
MESQINKATVRVFTKQEGMCEFTDEFLKCN